MILLAALFLGYIIRRLPVSNEILNKLLDYSILLILFSLGYGFGVDATHLWVELGQVVNITSVFVLTLFVFNFTSIALFFSVKKSVRIKVRGENGKKDLGFYFKSILSAFKFIVIIAIGLLIAVWLHHPIPNYEMLIDILLIIILFIIGHQLRGHGISLHKLILNPAGVLLALFVMVSSWIAGLIAAKWMGLPLSIGLIYTSGFGWYTLSGVLVSHLVGGQAGATIFFIDVLRELIVILCIPLLSAWQPEAMVGCCGATAMDFTLPMLKQKIGKSVISMAITSGMILTVITPILLPFLSHWAVAN